MPSDEPEWGSTPIFVNVFDKGKGQPWKQLEATP